MSVFLFLSQFLNLKFIITYIKTRKKISLDYVNDTTLFKSVESRALSPYLLQFTSTKQNPYPTVTAPVITGSDRTLRYDCCHLLRFDRVDA